MACVLQRKKTLLVEYRQLRKANAFVDRRFGEEDESLTAEEKAIARFQKQRMKEFGGEHYCWQAYPANTASNVLPSSCKCILYYFGLCLKHVGSFVHTTCVSSASTSSCP